MLCSVQWCTGERGEVGVFELAEAELGVGLGRWAATTSATGQGWRLVIRIRLQKTWVSRAARAAVLMATVSRCWAGDAPVGSQYRTRRNHGLSVMAAISVAVSDYNFGRISVASCFSSDRDGGAPAGLTATRR
jgi:hypothetical protein